MRFSDIKGLQWNNFIEISGQLCAHIRQRKTNAIQYLPISDKAKSYLPDRPENAADTDTVFNLCTNGYTNLYLKRWAQESGIKKQITFHTARHTFTCIRREYQNDKRNFGAHEQRNNRETLCSFTNYTFGGCIE
jgi:integrase